MPHNLKSWPTVQQLVKVIPNEFDIIINNDVIFIVPKKINFPKYIQLKITSENNKVTIKSLSTVFFSKISKMLNISKKKL